MVPGATSVSPASTTRATHAPCAASAANRAAPGAITRPGQPAATQVSSAPVSAAITAACAIWATVLPELMTAAGLRRRVLGRRRERAAHRLQALEQRPALGAPPRRQGDDGLALGRAREGVGLGEDLLPLRVGARPQAHLARALAPRADRLLVLGLGLEDAQAGHRRRARQLARAGQLGDGAATHDEVHAQRVASHFALLSWRKAESRSLRGRGSGGTTGPVRPAQGRIATTVA